MSAGPRVATRRLFLALWPTDGERCALAAAAAAVLQANNARAVAPQNLHLTLAFLGAVPVTRTAELLALSAELAAAWMNGPVALTWTGLEHWKRPQILAAVTATPCAAAAELATRLKRASGAAGFSPDLKAFRAHVTVARKVAAPVTALELPCVLWDCASLALVESRTDESGPVYSVLDSRLLGKREKMRRQH